MKYNTNSEYDDVQWNEISGNDLPEIPEKGSIRLPNGCTLYWRTDKSVNCREYYSDEIGGGVNVWHTGLVDQSTLLAAIVQEGAILKLECIKKERELKNILSGFDGKPIC